MSARAGIIAVAVTTLLLSGCTEDEGRPVAGSTEPTDPAMSTPAQQPSSSSPEAPKVNNPITNLEQFKQSPCDMVTDQQAKSLGFNPGEPSEDATYGPACDWYDDSFGYFGLTLLNNQPLGIAGIYRNQEQGRYGYFEPVDVAGYPGVYADANDGRKEGACTLNVGVTDTQVVTVTALLNENEAEACDLALQAAEAAVKTMSEG